MRQLKMEQLTDYTPLNPPSDILRPWKVDPMDGLPTFEDVTEESVRICSEDDVRLFFTLMGKVATMFYDRHGFQAYPTFRMEYDPRKP